MNKIIFRLILLFIVIQFYSCSWTLGFYIINSTNDEIQIEIKLQDTLVGNFPIFDYHDGTIYSVDKKNKIIYDKSEDIIYDTLSIFSNVIFKLPSKSAIQIGALQNDKYKSYDQYFINERVFNLEKITIKNSETVILKKDFDKYFKKDGNGITYIVK